MDNSLGNIFLVSQEYIKSKNGMNCNISSISEQTGFSKYAIRKAFMEMTGFTVRRYIEAQKDQTLINSGQATGNNLSKMEKESNVNSSVIRYEIGKSVLGYVLVAETESGLCNVEISDSKESLLNTIKRKFPNNKIVRDKSVDTNLQKIGKVIAGDLQEFTIDINGTEFQKSVWSEIAKIPYGKTKSYDDVAKAIGNRKSFRAVANACAENPIPLVIPCHRVIRKNGSLGGYGPGIKKKEFLIKMEKSKNIN